MIPGARPDPSPLQIVQTREDCVPPHVKQPSAVTPLKLCRTNSITKHQRTQMDGWTEVFTDSKGIKRCSRCRHTRPLQGVPPYPVAEGEGEPNITRNLQNILRSSLDTQRSLPNFQATAQEPERD